MHVLLLVHAFLGSENKPLLLVDCYCILKPLCVGFHQLLLACISCWGIVLAFVVGQSWACVSLLGLVL